jgi:hypothetical protein
MMDYDRSPSPFFTVSMNRRFHAAIVFLFLATILFLGHTAVFTTRSAAFVDGPPPAMTGGFGEETCGKCHYDYEANNEAGSLLLEGLPETYSPGRAYLITIRLTHPQLERGGFELAARFEAGEFAGRQAGSFEVLDERATVLTAKDNSIQYAVHTRSGSAPDSKGAISWSVRWRAPESLPAAVVFHSTANAANFDDSPLGDFPYSRSVVVRQAFER